MELVVGIITGIFIGYITKYTLDHTIFLKYNCVKILKFMVKKGYIKFADK